MAKIKNANVEKEINKLLDRFQDPESLTFVSRAMFKRGIDIPSDNWSLLNRLIMLANNTFDARGPKAWFKEGRKVKKAGHFCIIAPILIKKKTGEIDIKTGKEIEYPILIGFRPIAVWPIENTEGEDIEYKQDKPLPPFLCEDIAKDLGITIKQGFENPKYLGAYNVVNEEIIMATPDQMVFFHELVHVVDRKLNNKYKSTEGEIVAEFAADVLMHMFGLECNEKGAYSYIQGYADTMDVDVIEAVIPLIGKISKIINFIIEKNESLNS